MPEHLKKLGLEDKPFWYKFYATIFGPDYKDIMPWLRLKKRLPLPHLNFSDIWKHFKRHGKKHKHGEKIGIGVVLNNGTVLSLGDIDNVLLPTEVYYVFTEAGNETRVIRYNPDLVGGGSIFQIAGFSWLSRRLVYASGVETLAA